MLTNAINNERTTRFTNSQNLRLLNCKTTNDHAKLYNRCSVVWNDIPQDTKNVYSKETFCTKLKEHYLYDNFMEYAYQLIYSP